MSEGPIASAASPASAALREWTFFGHPIGLANLFFTEMWERFSYYGMRAILVLFLVASTAQGGFGLDDRTATAIYGLYTAAVYLVGLPGGWIADRLIGAQRAVLAGGIIIAVGHLLLGSAHAPPSFYLGLFVIVVGTGLLKPNVSSLVAQLYPEGGARRDSGFTLYYMGINLGGSIGPLVVGGLAAFFGWSAGFMAAAVGMVLGVVQFQMGRRLLKGVGRAPIAAAAGTSNARATPWLTGIGLALLLAVILVWKGVLPNSPVVLQAWAMVGIITIAILNFVYLFGFAGLSAPEKRRVAVVMVLFLASMLFWAGYEQAGSTLNLFTERYTDRSLFSWTVPSSWLQSLDSVFIIAFAPFFSFLWLALGRRQLDPSRPAKFVLGLLGLALGFIVMALAARIVVGGGKPGMTWLTITYMLHTAGELCLSPIGMSAFSQLVPARFIGQSLGIWFVSMSLGNLVASRIAGTFSQDNVAAMPWQYLQICLMLSLFALLLTLLLPWMKRWAA